MTAGEHTPDVPGYRITGALSTERSDLFHARAERTGEAVLVRVPDGARATDAPYSVVGEEPPDSYAVLLGREGALAADHVVEVGLDVAAELEPLHEAGMVHDLISPRTLLMRGSGAELAASRAPALSAGDAFSPLVLGRESVEHLPPEAFDGGRASPRSDVYRLASTLWTLLAGRAPYSRARGEHVSFEAYRERVAGSGSPGTPRAGLPRGLDRVLRVAMARAPADRYPDARAFASALAEVRDGAPVEDAPERPEPAVPSAEPWAAPEFPGPVRDDAVEEEAWAAAWPDTPADTVAPEPEPESAALEPVASEPDALEPVVPESAALEPVASEPDALEPVVPESAALEPVASEPDALEPAVPEQSPGEQPAAPRLEPAVPPASPALAGTRTAAPEEEAAFETAGASGTAPAGPSEVERTRAAAPDPVGEEPHAPSPVERAEQDADARTGAPRAAADAGERSGFGRMLVAATLAASIVIAVVGAVALVTVWLVLTESGGGPAAGPATQPSLATLPPEASQNARWTPTDVRIVADEQETLTLAWTDNSQGRASYHVVGGPVGTAPGTLAQGEPMTTRVEISGLNPAFDYCLTVVAVVSVDEVAPSENVCTDRFRGV